MSDVQSAGHFDQAEYRSVAGSFATGVCVVSGCEPNGQVSGITINSFLSVSLEPVLVSWSLQNTSSQFDLWTKAQNFSISVLAADQRHLAERYAAKPSDPSWVGDFILSDRAVPRVRGALAYLECRHWSLYRAGDHTLIFGEVVALGGSERPLAQGKPLIYFGSEFGEIKR